MRIVVPAVAFSTGISGMQRHALNLLRCLRLLPKVEAVTVVVAPWQVDLVTNAGIKDIERSHVTIAEIGTGALARNLWYYQELPKLARRANASIVHFTYPVPLNRKRLGCPAVLTLHDLYPFEIPSNFGFPKALVNQMILKQSLFAASAVACVSEATRTSLKKRFPEVGARALTIPNCVEAVTECAVDSPLPGWHGEPFLLCVSQHRRNKNIAVAIRSFFYLLRNGGLPSGSRLVVLGMDGPETQSLHTLVADLGLTTRVLLLKGLSDAGLQWCYTHCEALIAPSLVEGFGLPVAEARLAGCRVVCSDIPPFREVGGVGCEYVPLSDRSAELFAQALTRSLNMPTIPPEATSRFAAATLAPRYAALYELVLARERRQAA